MKRTLHLILASIVLSVSLSTANAEELVDDHFTSTSLEGRDLSPARGEWKLADGVATCTQDDELYKQHKNHGPIMWYDVALTDGVVRFAYKPQGVKQFVFTLNGDRGHVFRFLINNAGLSVRSWPEPGPKATPTVLRPPSGKPSLAEGEWTEVEVKFDGERCTLSLGKDFHQTFEHAAVAQPKTKLGLGFAFGTLSLRDVSVTAP